MEGLFRRRAFTEFGPSRLALGAEAPLEEVRARRSGRLRAAVRELCPRLPGVYGMVDALGHLIYVGKAKSLRARLLSYFRPKSRDPKAGRILRDTRRLVWQVVSSEFAALLRELELIRRWQPRHNVQGQPNRRRRTYLCVGRAPGAYAFVAAKPPRTAQAVFGPVAGVGTARTAARRLNDWFRLRDCPQKQVMRFADQRELFPLAQVPGCLRHGIGHCLAPCAAACTRDDYAFHLEALLDFLHGRDLTVLEALERDMQQASAELAFERAAALRDRLAPLQWLHRQLDRLRQALTCSAVYPVAGHDGAVAWYLLREGHVRAVVAAPGEVSGADALPQLEAVYGRSVVGGTGLDEVDGVLLVANWLRRYPEERGRLLDPETALKFCRQIGG